VPVDLTKNSGKNNNYLRRRFKSILEMKRILITSLLSLCVGGNALFSQVLKPEDLWKMGRVSDPQLSPDGKEVLYNVRTYDLAANKGNSDLWKVTVATATVVHLASGTGNESSAKWSADGKQVYYLDDQSGVSCLYSMMPDGSAKTVEAKLDGDINAYGISASANKIWFAMDVKVTKTAKDMYPDLPKATGRLYDDLMYRHWDRWDDGTFSHVFIADMENGKVKGTPMDIMKDEPFDCPMKPMDGEEQISWSPDGATLAYTCKKLSGRDYAMSTNSEIYLYDTRNKSTRNITEGAPGYDKNPLFSPDGKSIIWMSQHDAGNEADRRRIFLMDLASNQKRELTQGFDNDVEETKWSVSGQRIYMVSGINATVQVFVCEPFSKTPKPIRQLTSDEADHSSLSVAGNATTDYLVTSRMSISQPNELYSIDPKTGVSRQITFTNKDLLSSFKLAKVEKRMGEINRRQANTYLGDLSAGF
jgi:Tol biopolymer transport system component